MTLKTEGPDFFLVPVVVGFITESLVLLAFWKTCWFHSQAKYLHLFQRLLT